MSLLPAGEASIKRADDLNVGDGANKRHVTAYLIEGLGFSPATVWLEDDRSFFASVDRWFSVVREGWEASVPQMLEKQEALANAAHRRAGAHADAQAEQAGRASPTPTSSTRQPDSRCRAAQC